MLLISCCLRKVVKGTLRYGHSCCGSCLSCYFYLVSFHFCCIGWSVFGCYNMSSTIVLEFFNPLIKLVFESCSLLHHSRVCGSIWIPLWKSSCYIFVCPRQSIVGKGWCHQCPGLEFKRTVLYTSLSYRYGRKLIFITRLKRFGLCCVMF